MVFNLDCTLENTECFEKTTVRLKKNNRTSKFLWGMRSHWESGHNSPTPLPRRELCYTHTHTHTHTPSHKCTQFQRIQTSSGSPVPPHAQTHKRIKHKNTSNQILSETQANAYISFSLLQTQANTHCFYNISHFSVRFIHTFTQGPTLSRNILIAHKITNNAQLHRAITADSQPRQFYHRQPQTHTHIHPQKQAHYPPIGSCRQPGFSNHIHTREHSQSHN